MVSTARVSLSFVHKIASFERVHITGAFSYSYTPAIFRNKLTTLLVVEQSSQARNGQLKEFVYIMC